LFRSFGIGRIEEYLRRKGWKYVRMDDYVLTGLTSPSGRHYLIVVKVDRDRKTVLFLFNPVKRPPDALASVAVGGTFMVKVHPDQGHSPQRVAEVCEALMHWNYTILLGSFERDHRDGEIRYRVAVPYRDTDFTFDQFNWCVLVSISTLDRVMPRIEKLADGDISLDDALGEGPAPSGPTMV